MPTTSNVWLIVSSSSLMTGSSWRGGSVVVASREWNRPITSPRVPAANDAKNSSLSRAARYALKMGS